jgi:hypothetical protein
MNKLRLSNSFIPEKYQLNFDIDINNLEYSLDMSIQIRINKLEKHLIIHSTQKYFKILNILIKKKLSKEDPISVIAQPAYSQSKDIKDSITPDSLAIEIPSSLGVEEGDVVILRIAINGIISTKDKYGFFLSFDPCDPLLAKLNTRDEFMKYWRALESFPNNMAITCLCQPIDYRNYFPCFEEPCFKSTYVVQISIDKRFISQQLKVLSNTQCVEVIDSYNKVTYRFDKTPVMSIYLLTLVIGNYEVISSNTQSTKLSLYTPIGCLSRGELSLDTAVRALKFFEDYFNIPYELGKLDLVPVPYSENSKALECWGCIVFDKKYLLIDNDMSPKDHIMILRFICHELSHMWFGNLITMDYWDDLWLNEGFARYMEFFCLDKIRPDLNAWDHFFEDIYLPALATDESMMTHSIEKECISQEYIMEVFDEISYSKGACIVNMLASYLGEDVFKQAINTFIREYRYKSIKSQNLWDVIYKLTGNDVTMIMKTWLSQKGHPKVSLTLEKRDGDDYIKFRQSPYPDWLFDNDQLWIIPLFIKVKDRDYNMLLKDKQIMIKLDTFGIRQLSDSLVIVNHNRSGFYRVEYSEDCLFNINKHYSKYDIAGLLDDYINCKDYIGALSVIDLLKPFDDLIVLKKVISLYDLLKKYCFSISSVCKLVRVDKHLDTLTSKINEVFSKAVTYDLRAIKNLLQTNGDHEYLNILLYIHCNVEKREELIEYLINLFMSNPTEIIVRGLYSVLGIVLGNYYELRQNKLKEKEYYMFALNEYNETKANLSNDMRYAFLSAFVNFEYMSDDLVDMFYTRYIDEQSFYDTFVNINPCNLYPNSRVRILHTLIKKLIVLKGRSNRLVHILDFLETHSWFLYEYMKIIDQVYDDSLVVKLNEYIANELEIICKTPREKDDLSDMLFDKTNKRAVRNKNVKCDFDLVMKKVSEYLFQ